MLDCKGLGRGRRRAHIMMSRQKLQIVIGDLDIDAIGFGDFAGNAGLVAGQIDQRLDRIAVERFPFLDVLLEFNSELCIFGLQGGDFLFQFGNGGVRLGARLRFFAREAALGIGKIQWFK